MEERTFQSAMTYLAAAYAVDLSKERAAVYYDQLGSLRDEPFWAAVKVAVSNDQWFPTVSRLRELYREELRRESQQRLLPLPALDKSQGRQRIAELKAALGQGSEP